MTQFAKERRILGIDPGTNILGYSVIEQRNKSVEILTMDVLVLGSKEEMNTKMKSLFDKIVEIIDCYHPDMLAIEAPFFGKNVQSMLKLGRAQGVAMAAAINHSIPITEYAPLKIKMAITGNGSSSKEQVAYMLQNLLNINKEDMPKFLDATDALGAAYCHFIQICNPIHESTNSTGTKLKTGRKSSSKSWEDFVNNNPDRVSK